MSLIKETAYYTDSNIEASTYDKRSNTLSIIYKSGHIEELKVNMGDYILFKESSDQTSALKKINKITT